MKRLISLILAATMAFALAACAGDVPETPPVEDGGPVTAEPTAGVDYPLFGGTADRSGLSYLDAVASYEKTDWTAQWIWTGSCSEDSYVALRKTFTADSEGVATAYISAVDKYVLWLNGELTVLDGSLKRGPTPYDSYYDTVELPLRAGKNTIAVLVAFNGRSGDGSIVPVVTDSEGDEYTQAGFLFEMRAGDTVIKSDGTWKAQRHSGYKNRVTGGADYVRYDQSSMLAERNVWYSAADGIGDFAAPDYDDSAWEKATLIAKPGDLPFGALYSAMIRTPKFGSLIDFSGVPTGEITEDATLTLSLPGNMQFTWYIELEAPEGKRLTVYTNTYTDRQNMANFKDTYVTGKGAQSYENWPWRSGSKLIIEAEAGVKFTRIAYRPSGFNGEWAGSFLSDNADLNELWQESLNTIAICMRDTYMDCPERERGPYMGDAANQIDAALYSYDEGGLAITKKALLACVAWTPQTGAIPSRAPSVKPQEIPNQSLSLMTTAYHYWLHSGDAETMTAYYRAFVNYLRLFEMGENGLPLYRDGSWTWNDWGNNIDTKLLQVGFYYYALRVTKALADDLGITEDSAFLTERMAAIEGSWRDCYYTPEGFKDPSSRYIDDRANALLALSGLAGEEDRELITSVIMNTCEASPYTEKFVLEALCVMGRTDLALKRMLDRYGLMLNDEWDTLYEQFNDETGTYNHGWTAAPLYILSKYAAGIRPTKAGWEEYEIVLNDALESYSCTVWTPKGNITVVRSGGSVTVNAVSGGTLVTPAGERLGLSEGENTFSVR